MTRISSEEELLNTFRPIDREKVRIPSDWTFPLLVKDYVAWVDPSGHRTFLVFEDPQKQMPLGIAFRRSPTSQEAPAGMCDWCHCVRGGAAVGMMSVAVSDKRTIGLTLCRDLSCRDKILGEPDVNDIRESLSQEQKVMRIMTRISEFARRNLF